MNETWTSEVGPHQLYRRARQLHDHGRHQEALQLLQQGLQLDPNHDMCLNLMALCYTAMDQFPKALGAIDRAIVLDPEFAFHHQIRAVVLLSGSPDGKDSRVLQGMASAEKSIELAPEDSNGYSLQARAYIMLGKWAEGEKAARKALSLNVDDAMAAQVLSIALRQQGKDEDNASLVAYQLANNPQDDSTHVSAGFLALSQGDHQKANQHFLEALRLDPMNEGARLGLLESYRARSLVYRSYARLCRSMERISGGHSTALWLGGYVAYRLLYSWLHKINPALATLLAVVWLIFIFWSIFARGFGSFFMVLDSTVRRCMKRKEIAEGLAVGGTAFMALGLLMVGLVVNKPGLSAGSMTLFFAAASLAVAFLNDHYWGKWVNWGLACIGSMAGLYSAVSHVGGLDLPYASAFFTCTIVCALLSGFSTFFRFMYR